MIIIPESRRTRVSIIYQGKDITQDIAPYLLSFSFTDNSRDKADDISLSLEDRAGTWLRDWTPAKSDTITASIIKSDGQETTSLPCGSFSVDQIDYSYPPAVMSIKATSSDIKTKAAQEKHTKSWENASISSIAADIAASNGLALFMNASESTTFERIDQTEQTDLDFLKDLCADYGLAVKIQKKQLVIYDIEEYEAKEPVTSLSIDDDRLISFKFSSKSAKVYKKARVRYHDALKNEDYEAEYEDDDEEGSERVLEIHERVESQAQAETVAQKRLTDANRKELTGSLSMIGDVSLAAGVNIELEDFGSFSGKHFVNKVTHKVDRSGYTVSVELGQPKDEKGKGKAKKKAKQSRGTESVIYYEGDRHY